MTSYFIIISLTCSLSLFWLFARSKKFDQDLPLNLDLGLIVLIAGFIGARAFHVVIEEPTLYINNPMFIFYFWQGGYVFLGGLIFAFLGCYIFARIKKITREEFSMISDTFAPCISLGHLLGRLGCLIAGCCYGKAAQIPWAIDGRHPTVLYSIVWEFLILMSILKFEKSFKQRYPPGIIFIYWIATYSIGRFFIEFFRDDFRGPEFIFSISGWISLALIVISLFWFKRSLRISNKKAS